LTGRHKLAVKFDHWVVWADGTGVQKANEATARVLGAITTCVAAGRRILRTPRARPWPTARRATTTAAVIERRRTAT